MGGQTRFFQVLGKLWETNNDERWRLVCDMTKSDLDMLYAVCLSIWVPQQSINLVKNNKNHKQKQTSKKTSKTQTLTHLCQAWEPTWSPFGYLGPIMD